MSHSTLTLVTLAVVVVLFVSNRFPVELVAVGSALALYAVGVLTLPQALAGFGDPAVILIASLFVVSEGLDATGVTAWVGQTLANKTGDSTRLLLILTMLLAAGLTALIGLNGTVAALLPMAVVVAMRRGFPPSRLLMPLAFAGSAGGMLLLTGSPVNVVISEAAADAGVGAFGFLEFAIVGIPLVVGTIAIVMLVSQRLLPDRTSDSLPPDLSGLARELVLRYSLDQVFRLRVTAASDLIGAPRGSWQLDSYPGMSIITVLDAATGRPVSDGVLALQDRLTVVGGVEVATRFAVEHGLDVESVRGSAEVEASILSRDSGVAEVVIPPRSTFVGADVQPSQVIDGSLVLLAVTRQGKDLGARQVRLKPGDVLLLEGPWAALDVAERDHNVLVVDSPELVRRQTVPLGRRSGFAIAVLAAMGVVLATGLVPAVLAALHGAAGLPRDLVDDRSPGVWHDPDGHRRADLRRRRACGYSPGWCCGRRRADGASGGAVRHHCGLWSADQQHGNGSRDDPDRGFGCLSAPRVSASRADESVRRGGRGLPHPSRDTGEHDGDGTRRLPLRGLLEARAADRASLRCRVRGAGSARLALLTVRSACWVNPTAHVFAQPPAGHAH